MKPQHASSSHATASPPATLTLRAATNADRAFLLALYAATRQGERQLTAWPEAQWRAFIAMQFDIQQHHYQHGYQNPAFNIVYCDEVRIGKMDIEYSDDNLHIIDIALLPEYCNRGIGGNLIRQLQSEGRTHSKSISLCVQKHHRAFALYSRLGFETVADLGTSWRMQYRADRPIQLADATQ